MIMMQKMFTQTQNVAILNVAINFIGVLNHISLFDNNKRSQSLNSGHSAILNSNHIHQNINLTYLWF